MNTKTPELMPCPFCGRAGMFDSDDDTAGEWRVYWAQCSGCGAEGAYARTVQEAADSWNTRHFGRTLTNEIGASAGERSHEAAQAVIDNEAASIKRDAENQG